MSEIPIKAMKYDDANKDPHQFYPLIVPEAIIFPDGTNGKQAFDAVINDMSDVFSDQKTYEVGDYCIYNNVLYKFIAQKTAGAWDSLKASVTTIDAELKSLLNQINTLNSGIFSDIRLAVKQVSANSNTKIKIQYGEKTGLHQFALIYGDCNGNPFLAISNANGAATIHAIGGESVKRNEDERSCIVSIQPWSEVWILLDAQFVDDIEISVYS